MIAFVNGQFAPEEQASVPALDHGFLYGDGLFETVRVSRGRVFRWARHARRLERGAALLGIPLPCPGAEFETQARELARRNRAPEAVLRLTVSRGMGPRGYTPPHPCRPTVVMTLTPAGEPAGSPPALWRLATSSHRVLATDPLNAVKTCNKLRQVLARLAAQAAGADEALLLNESGRLAEAAAANLFWCASGAVCTPPLSEGALPGITRELTLELCRALGIPARETPGTCADLRRAEGVFLTLSGLGLVETASLDGADLARSALFPRLRAAYLEILRAECAG